jgi:HK97 gp10 family phage protein
MARGISPKMELVGVADLIAQLNALPPRLAQSSLDRGLIAVAKPIAEAARVRIEVHTGKTKAKILVSKKLSRRQAKQAGPKDSKWVRVVYVGVAPSTVAHLIEFGTVLRHWTGGGDARRRAGRLARAMQKAAKSTGRMTPAPYMRPAWDGGKMKALNDFGVMLGKDLEKTAARYAKRLAKKR